MPRASFELTCPVVKSFRTAAVRGMFDLTDSKTSVSRFDVELPDLSEPWTIGAIVGPSGSGKSSVARHAWPDSLYSPPRWPADASVLDGFPGKLEVKELAALLNAVGFSSPPAWLRPHRVLSNGEQFRVNLARAIADAQAKRGERLVVYDEFTSVVDRTVAKIGSAALAKALRRLPPEKAVRFVAVTCHYDVLEWLCPDWVLDMATGRLARGSLRPDGKPLYERPAIPLSIAPVHRSAWDLFRRHHYLSESLSPTARCWAAWWGERPVAFSAWLQRGAAGNRGDPRDTWREHRTVVLPDFQGVGIGNRLSEWLAALLVARGLRALSTTSHPAMIRHRAASPLWRMARLGRAAPNPRPHQAAKGQSTSSAARITGGFEYIGPPGDQELAAAHWEARPARWFDTPAMEGVLALLAQTPGQTAPLLAARLSLSDTAVRTALEELAADGRVQALGGTSRRDPHAFYLTAAALAGR